MDEGILFVAKGELMSLIERGFYLIVLLSGIAIAFACGAFWWAAQYYEWDWVFHESQCIARRVLEDDLVIKRSVPYVGAVVCQVIIAVISITLVWIGVSGVQGGQSDG